MRKKNAQFNLTRIHQCHRLFPQYRQFREFQHQHLYATVVEMHGGFLVRPCAVDAEDGACTEFGVHHPHAFLQKVGVGRLQVLRYCRLTGGRFGRRLVLDFAEAMLLWLGDRSAKAPAAEDASAATYG